MQAAECKCFSISAALRKKQLEDGSWQWSSKHHKPRGQPPYSCRCIEHITEIQTAANCTPQETFAKQIQST